MKILYISDYAAHECIAEGKMPSHHLFGMAGLINRFISKTSAVIKAEYGGGTIDFLTLSRPSKKEILCLYLRIWGGHYDVVYDVLNVVSKYFTVLNKYHLFRPRLVTILHHPPFGRYMKYGKADVTVFFTEILMNDAVKFVSDDRKIVFNNWYPDKKWYDENRKLMESDKVYDFLDNGKTQRNHNLFIRSMRAMPDKKGVIVTDKNHIPSEYREGENIDLYFQGKPNDYTMQQLCMQTRVMVIPLIENGNNLLGPYGYTSYMDAIALGMPVVTNKTAAMAKEIVDNGLGCVFDSSEESMTSALQKSLEQYAEISEKMRRFSENHTIENYTQKLLTYIK